MNHELRTYGGRAGAERRSDRRDRIMAVGRRLLTADDGPAGFTVRGVCREAALTPRYFYESFDDAGALARAVYTDCVATIVADTLGALGDLDTEPQLAVHRGIATVIDLIADDPARGRLLFSPALAAVPEIADERTASTRLFVQLVGSEATTRTGLDVSGPTLVAAEMLVGAVAQVVSAWLDRHLQVDRDELVDTVARIFWSIGEAVTTASADRPRD